MPLIDTSLVTAPGSSLVPSTSNLSQLIGNALIKKSEIDREDARLQQVEDAKKVQQTAKTNAAQLLRIRGIKDFQTQRSELAKLGQAEVAAGRDGSIFIEALNSGTPDELNLAITRAATAQGNADKLIEAGLKQQEGAKPFTLSPGQQRFTPSGEVIAEVPETKDGVAGISQVQSSEFLPGGGTRIVRKDGTIEVVQPTEEETAIIRSAEQRGVDLQQQRAKGRGLGKGGAKIANDALDLTDKLRKNNLTLKKVIAEVRGGAETGPLARMLPSFRASTLRLKQLQNQLGLDVVGSVTFGALSEGELQLAMDTALPTGLDGPELVEWANTKIAAQEKLAEYLEDQAIFLSKPGNTAADWLELGRNKKAITESQPASVEAAQQQPVTQPQILRFDAQGNLIQ